MNTWFSKKTIQALLPLMLGCAAIWVLPGLGWAPFLAVGMVALLAVGLWPEYLTALLFFTLAMLLHVGTTGMVFAGFSSSAFWLILGGFFMGQAVTVTGLGDRIAGWVVRYVPKGYGWSVCGVTVFAVAMSFLMPSAMGRVLLLMPIFKVMAKRLGCEDDSKEASGLILCGLIATYIPAVSILPANIPNMVLVGAAESVGLPRPDFGHYLLLHFPVLGALKALLIALITYFLFRPTPEENAALVARRAGLSDASVRPWDGGEIRLSIVLALCLSLWCTDSLHGISPAWVGMAGGIACLFPVIGVLDPQKSIREVNLNTLLYVASIISLGAVVNGTGLGARIADVLLSILPLSQVSHFLSFMELGFLNTVLGVVATTPGVPAVATPLTAHLAAASGLSAYAVMMTQVLAYSTIFFPFQTGPMLVGLHIMHFPIGRATKIMVLLAVLTVVLLWPLEYLEWWFLGVV